LSTGKHFIWQANKTTAKAKTSAFSPLKGKIPLHGLGVKLYSEPSFFLHVDDEICL
jgi:hypothetical protein